MTNHKKTSLPVIIIVDNSQAVTGALNAICNATNALRDSYKFIYALPKGSSACEVLLKNNYKVYELPFVEISRRKSVVVTYFPMLLINGWRLWRLSKREGAAIIHSNDFYNLTGYIARIFSLKRLSIITHVRFLPQSLPQILARTWRFLAIRLASRIVCVSQAVGNYFVDANNSKVIYDPLPGTEQHAEEIHKQGQSNAIHLLYLSNYIQGKGQDFALQAFIKAYSYDSRLRLRFVGGDMGLEKNREFRRQLEATVQQAGLEQAVSFDGFVADVEAAIKTADIVLNFSESESFSLTCLDALFYGTPLIATDCGGPAELFEHGQSGWLVPNRDVPAMVYAINKLASDASLRVHFAAAGRMFVRQKFAPDNTYKALASLYGEVLINSL